MSDKIQALTPEERARWIDQAGFPQLDQILYWRWDPIGVAEDLPYSEGEYEEYARELASILLDGASREEIAAYLLRVERELMGVGSDKNRALEVAGFVEQWFPKSVEQWREFGKSPTRRRR